MSQAHYVRCGHLTLLPEYRDMGCGVRCESAAVAVMHMPYVLGNRLPMCLDHMAEFFDRRDDEEQDGNPFRHEEPTRLEWVFDAGTRTCPLHHWPDVVCADWATEHAAMLRAMWPALAGRTLVGPPVPDLRSLTRG